MKLFDLLKALFEGLTLSNEEIVFLKLSGAFNDVKKIIADHEIEGDRPYSHNYDEIEQEQAIEFINGLIIKTKEWGLTRLYNELIKGSKWINT